MICLLKNVVSALLPETGIAPIVTASMAMQLMAGNSAIEVDQSRKEDRALFAGAQKVRHLLQWYQHRKLWRCGLGHLPQNTEGDRTTTFTICFSRELSDIGIPDVVPKKENPILDRISISTRNEEEGYGFLSLSSLSQIMQNWSFVFSCSRGSFAILSKTVTMHRFVGQFASLPFFVILNAYIPESDDWSVVITAPVIMLFLRPAFLVVAVGVLLLPF